MLAMTAFIGLYHKSTSLLFDTWENVSRDPDVVSECRVHLITLQKKVPAKTDIVSRGQGP